MVEAHVDRLQAVYSAEGRLSKVYENRILLRLARMAEFDTLLPIGVNCCAETVKGNSVIEACGDDATEFGKEHAGLTVEIKLFATRSIRSKAP
jgi:hypothetical protein